MSNIAIEDLGTWVRWIWSGLALVFVAMIKVIWNFQRDEINALKLATAEKASATALNAVEVSIGTREREWKQDINRVYDKVDATESALRTEIQSLSKGQTEILMLLSGKPHQDYHEHHDKAKSADANG